MEESSAEKAQGDPKPPWCTGIVGLSTWKDKETDRQNAQRAMNGKSAVGHIWAMSAGRL